MTCWWKQGKDWAAQSQWQYVWSSEHEQNKTVPTVKTETIEKQNKFICILSSIKCKTYIIWCHHAKKFTCHKWDKLYPKLHNFNKIIKWCWVTEIRQHNIFVSVPMWIPGSCVHFLFEVNKFGAWAVQSRKLNRDIFHRPTDKKCYSEVEDFSLQNPLKQTLVSGWTTSVLPCISLSCYWLNNAWSWSSGAETVLKW